METTSLHRAEEVHIPTEAGDLPGFLDLPHQPRGLVLFAHGSGSSRFSRRNREVAQTLNHGGIATLLFDLLTAPEHDLDQRTAELRFNIPLLTRRLIQAVDWAQGDPRTAALSIGLFGASTGAAAALGAAAARPEAVRAVVSRGGRPGWHGASAEPGGRSAHAGPTRDPDHRRRQPPVRGARQARTGGGNGARLVHRAPVITSTSTRRFSP
jgi:dienelactone hydrolase